MKKIVLIRHGQSLGQQAARQNSKSRNDPSLVDCFLSSEGIREALALRTNPTLREYEFDLVCTSPLTRAIATCVLAFRHGADERSTEQSSSSSSSSPSPSSTIRDGCCHPGTTFVAHSHLSEVGRTGIPENIGREIPVLKKDLAEKLATIAPSSLACLDRIDFSLLPESWPRRPNNADVNANTKTNTNTNTNTNNRKSEKKRILNSFLDWLSEREEETIAVVCHYNVIKWFLGNQINHVPNCVPIECSLAVGDPGTVPRLVLKSTFD